MDAALSPLLNSLSLVSDVGIPFGYQVAKSFWLKTWKLQTYTHIETPIHCALGMSYYKFLFITTK